MFQPTSLLAPVSGHLLQSLCSSCDVLQKRTQDFCKYKEKLQIRIQGNCIPSFAPDPVSLLCLVTNAPNPFKVEESLSPTWYHHSFMPASSALSRRQKTERAPSFVGVLSGNHLCLLPLPAALFIAQTPACCFVPRIRGKMSIVSWHPGDNVLCPI